MIGAMKEAELEAELPRIHNQPGPYFAVVKVMSKTSPRINAPKDGTYVSRRFRAAVTGESA